MSEGNGLEQYLEDNPQQGSPSPAAPAGAQPNPSGGGSSKLNQWLIDNGGSYADTAQSWYSGGNAMGRDGQPATQNGWSTDFTEAFVSGWDQALQDGTAVNYFDKADATGVVTWDHTSEETGRDYKWGDVYEKGEFKGNLYDQYDRRTANLMVMPWVSDRTTQAKTFEEDNGTGDAVDSEMKRERLERSNNFADSLTAAMFQEGVAEKADEYRDGIVDEATVLGGAAAGAATFGAAGAAAGSLFGGIGAAPVGAAGAVIGGIAGGVGAFLNRDALVEQAARASEITRMSYTDFGLDTAIATGATQWGGFASRLFTPTSNLTQGLYDAVEGKGGDGVSEFYATDQLGQAKVSGWVKAADVASTVGDSLVQFASPLGLSMYSAQMGTTILGQVGELGTSGSSFDYASGTFDNVFTDDQGNFDLSSAAAGIGKVGIDAVQLGMARGLAGKTNALRTGGATASGADDALYRTGLFSVGEKLPLWLGGSKGLADDAVRVRAGGFSFTQSASGEIVDGSRRMTLGLLAPSELLTSLGARQIAMRSARARGGALTADDFYRGATQLANGERAMTSALLTAFGEGTEEAVQSVLEPLSHQRGLDADEIWNSAMYGAAGGLGMGAAMALQAPTIDKRLSAQARASYAMMSGGDAMTDAEWTEYWSGLSDLEKRGSAAMGKLAAGVAEAAYTKISSDQAMEQSAGVVGIAKFRDAVMAQMNANKATDRTDGAFVITQFEDTAKLDPEGNLLPGAMPVDAVGSSAVQMARNLMNHARGIRIQMNSLTSEVEGLQAQVAAEPDNEEAAANLASRTELLGLIEHTLRWSSAFDEVVDGYLERMAGQNSTVESIEAEVEGLNALLRDAFNRRVPEMQGVVLSDIDKEALSRAVSMLFARDPHDSSGSFQMLVPQVSTKLTLARNDNVLQISHAILPSLRGDFDGDKIRPLNQLILDQEEFIDARSGANFVGAGTSVNVGAPSYEKVNVDLLSKALKNTGTSLQTVAQNALHSINTAVRARYAGILDSSTLDSVLESFSEAVRSNSKDARKQLIDGLASRAGAQLTEFSRSNQTNEWLWMDQLIVSTMQRFQESYAAHTPFNEAPNTKNVRPVAGQKRVHERRAARAATLAADLANFAPGDSLFRKFQKLHYSARGAAVLSANGVSEMSADDMIALYREIGAGISTSELDNVRGVDEITARVYAQLQAIADDAQALNPQLNRLESMLLVANMRVADFDISLDGEYSYSGGEVSLAQMLLKQSVARDRREKDRIFDASPELQAKHARLLSMTRQNSSRFGSAAEKALIEIVGSQQMYTLLGEAADVLGAHLTPEQWVRKYSNLDADGRADMARELRLQPEYLGRKGSIDMPYNLDEILDKKGRPTLSSYRALVDAMVAVGNDRISISYTTRPDGVTSTLHGEIADRSDRVKDNFKVAHEQARRSLQEFEQLSPRRDNESEVDHMRRLLESNPDFARAVMNLVPNATAAASFQVKGEQVFASNWLFELFTIADVKQAEMHYWRNLLIAEWNALGMDTRVEEEDGFEGESQRRYDRLPRRMHRIIYSLRKADQNGYLLQEFVQKMEAADDLDKFISWVNTTPGIRGDQAPITAWVDDVAEFDIDKAQGGWTTALQGAELREAIGNLRTRAEGLSLNLQSENTAIAADGPTLQAIARVIAYDEGGTVTPESGDRELYERFARTIDLAGEHMISVGPQTMLAQTLGAVQGFNSQSHNKGVTPPNVTPLGAFDARRDAYEYVTNYERYVASLTTLNLQAVDGALNETAKAAGRTMDDHGRVVEWDKPTPKQMLGLLQNADTRPFARAILFPQVMERSMDGAVRPQMLMGKSLTGLLNQSSFNELYPHYDEAPSRGAAFKYLSKIEGITRKFNGHFDVQRMANDLVIARTSASDHVLTPFELEQIVETAYYEIAMILQKVGALASQRMDPNTDPLGDMLKAVKKQNRLDRTALVLGLDVDEGQHTEAFISSAVKQKEVEVEEAKQRLLADIKDDPTREAELLSRIDEVELELDQFTNWTELLLTDDAVGQAVDMFTLNGSTQDQAAKKTKISEYILGDLTILGRASASRIVINKLVSQLRDPARVGQPDLTDAEWTEISRAVIGVYLDDAMSSVRTGLSVAPFPDEAKVDDVRYFDSSYGYLADKLLDPQGPLVQAARELHRIAGRETEEPPTESQFIDLLGRTIFDPKRLGPWTSDIPRQSIEANSRIDSAAAAAAIAMAGDSPKRLAALMSATRRRANPAKPDESMHSTVTLNRLHLDGKGLSSVAVTLPNGNVVDTPLPMMNNRFASKVTLVAADGTEVDLLAEYGDVGRPWVKDASVRDSGYQGIHLDRIKLAVARAVRERGINADFTVQVEFLHPDSQPAAPEWANSVYFEGTNFKNDGDTYDSLLQGLWFAPGAISPSAQAAALDASKLGLPALKVIDVATPEQRKEMESDWATDLAGVMRTKAAEVISSDLGFGELEDEYFNAVYKDMKIRHYVSGIDESGNRVLWRAEQVVEHQVNNPGVPIPLDDAQLWVPSDAVLRTMLGEQGNKGVALIYQDTLEIDPNKIPTFTGVTEKMAALFKEGIAGETARLEETNLVARAHMSQLTVRTKLDPVARSAYERKMEYQRGVISQVATARSKAQRDQSEGGFNANRNLQAAIERSSRLLSGEDLRIFWERMGVPFGPRDPNKTALSSMLLRDLAQIKAGNEFRTGWIYREGSAALPPKGQLNQQSLGEQKDQAYRVAPGDLVVVELDSFAGDIELAEKRMQFFADSGAIVVLNSEQAATEMRVVLSEILQGRMNYEPIAGSVHAYMPAEYGTRYQNPRAQISTLTETRGISRKNRIAVFSAEGLRMEENAAWVNRDNERLSAIGVSTNLVPTSSLATFNVPVGKQIGKVRQHLLGMDNEAGLKLLLEQANGHITDKHKRELADTEFRASFRQMIQRFETTDGIVLPVRGEKFGLGSIIPLIDNLDRVVLYRQGYKAPMREDIDIMSAQSIGTGTDAANVAVFPSKRESAATVHTGEVVKFIPRSGFGLSVELNIGLDAFGEKLQLELNGMKYVTTPWSNDVKVPDHGFFQDWGIDLVSDAKSLFAKEAVGDMVDSHRNAFAFFGIDFMPDMVRFFFPNEKDSATAERATREILNQIATRADRVPVRTVNEFMAADRLSNMLSTKLGDLAGAWTSKLDDLSAVENKIAGAMIMYLLTPGARVEHVLRSGGFNSPDPTMETQSRLMPYLFTQIFDQAPMGSPLRLEINRRLNDQIYNPNTDGTGYHLTESFEFQITNSDPGKNLHGFLSFPEAHSSGDNPIKNGMSFDESQRTSVSAHSAAIAAGAIGADTAYSYDFAKARNFFEAKGITRFERDKLDGGAWRMLGDIPKSDKSFHRWVGETPAESLRRSNARKVVGEYRMALDKTEDYGWSTEEIRQYSEMADSVLLHLNLKSSQHDIVDYWVRQIMGARHSRDASGKDEGGLTGRAAIEALTEIYDNVHNGYLPVLGGEVPALHLHDLREIYRANRHNSSPWGLKLKLDPNSKTAQSWNDWVSVALGTTALESTSEFDPMHLLALDGFVHTYQGATKDTSDLPVSVSTLVQQELFDPNTNRMVVSMLGNTDLSLQETMALDIDQATIDRVTGGRYIQGRLEGKRPPASEITKKRERRRKWRKEHDVPVPVDTTVKDLRANGVEMIQHGVTTNALVRGVINLRVGTALINPALWVSAGPEMFIRGGLDRIANNLTGQGTTGFTANYNARATESMDKAFSEKQIQKLEKLEGQLKQATTADEKMRIQSRITMVRQAESMREQFGLTSRYTPMQLDELNKLYRVLGERSDFKGMIYRDLMFLRPKADGLSRPGRALEGYAKLGSRMQDPTYGVRGNTLARRYMEAALQDIMATPTRNLVTIESIIDKMSTDPMYLKNNFPDAHRAGENSIAQIRSLKETTLSLALKGIYEPLSDSSNSFVSTFSSLLLKVPFLFSTYALNVSTSVLGLQGYSDMAAMFLDGRKKGPGNFFGRVQAVMNGRQWKDGADDRLDMSSVLEGVDLSRSFLRGSLTHTGLFMFGMMAGGIGLGGEDDEAKKRRLMAQAQGLGTLYDPRQMENDFRNAEAIFSDIPFIGGMGMPHWMYRQFLSPIIGMAKFFETGDFRQVTWGFEDALASFPLINTAMWNDTAETAQQLANLAGEEAEKDTPDSMTRAMLWLTSAVGVYERMLFENAFVNSVYIGMDTYDRDPYVLPLTDSDGTLQRDIEGNARPNDLALETYIDEDGKIASGYTQRSDKAAGIRVMTENRATLAFVGSLFTGGLGQSDWLRYNMPVKEVKFSKPEVDETTAEAFILAALRGANLGTEGVANLSIAEAEKAVREDLFQKKGYYAPDSEVMPIAEALVRSSGDALVPETAAAKELLMSETDADGNERVTFAGAEAIFRGLFRGTITLDDEALAGVHIPYEMREEIGAKYAKELIQESVDLGLDETAAVKRMERIMFYPSNTDADVLGFNEILKSNKISYSPTQSYAQLNTTYVKGPDGRMWATGFERGGLLSALGLQPTRGLIKPEGSSTEMDSRGNIVDLVNGFNTGRRAIVPLDDSRNIPTDVEIGEGIEKAIREAASGGSGTFTPFANSGGGGGYGYRSYGGYGGGGGGGGGGGSAYFVRMNPLPQNMSPYGHNAPFINTGNPIIRRADVRRERVWSERGRLKQWQ